MEFDTCSRGSSFRELRVETGVTNGNLEPASSVIELRQRFTEACGVPPYLPKAHRPHVPDSGTNPGTNKAPT
jgi:hypothetical protein